MLFNQILFAHRLTCCYKHSLPIIQNRAFTAMEQARSTTVADWRRGNFHKNLSVLCYLGKILQIYYIYYQNYSNRKVKSLLYVHLPNNVEHGKSSFRLLRCIPKAFCCIIHLHQKKELEFHSLLNSSLTNINILSIFSISRFFLLVVAILDSDTCVFYAMWLDVQFGSSNQIVYLNPGIRLQNGYDNSKTTVKQKESEW
jgi:hypothetical protein